MINLEVVLPVLPKLFECVYFHDSVLIVILAFAPEVRRHLLSRLLLHVSALLELSLRHVDDVLQFFHCILVRVRELELLLIFEVPRVRLDHHLEGIARERHPEQLHEVLRLPIAQKELRDGCCILQVWLELVPHHAVDLCLAQELRLLMIAQNDDKVERLLSDPRVRMQQEGQELLEKTVVDDVLILRLLVVEQGCLRYQVHLQKAGKGPDDLQNHKLLRVVEELDVDQQHVLRQCLLADLEANADHALEAVELDEEFLTIGAGT